MIANAISGLVRSQADEAGHPKSAYRGWENCTVPISEYGKVLNQMVALGLVEGRPHPHVPEETLWFATLFGVQTGTTMLAIKRHEVPF